MGPLLRQYADRLPPAIAEAVERLATISRHLRKEREFSFYGDEDFIPTEQYTREEAAQALDDARFVVGLIEAFRNGSEGVVNAPMQRRRPCSRATVPRGAGGVAS